jgi:hypothetical protein
VLDFWRSLFRREVPLSGGPGSGRPRTWSAESGYVYEYQFAGLRRVRQGSESVIEYVFEVSGGRGPKTPLSVILREERLAAWTGRARELTASERYGIAKICLKRALDRFPAPDAMQRELHPDAAELREIADTLDL